MKKKLIFAALLVCLFLFPDLAQAHTVQGQVQGLSHGFFHPLGGLDHLCAMIAVGLWAVQLGGRAVWAMPCAFIAVMILGGYLGMTGWNLPYVEQGILASVMILGLMIAAAVRLPVIYCVGIVGLFALFHGHAHGAEMPDSTSGIVYGLGFVLATALLHLSGIGLGVGLKKIAPFVALRWTGVAVVACGLYLSLV